MEEILNGKYEIRDSKLYKNNTYIKDYNLFYEGFIQFEYDVIHKDNDLPAIEKK